MAKLHFKYGTMNSGKSMDLIRTIYNYEENGFNVLLLKPAIDTKGNDFICSRNGMKRHVDIMITKDTSIISEVLDIYDSNTKCIFVDEAQFLEKEQIDELFLLTKELDIPVICYGLRNNFKMEGFEGSIRLLEIAEELEELPTLCKCGEIARYVGRCVNGKYVSEGAEVVIDGSNDEVKYEPMCGKCYLMNVKGYQFSKKM